MSPDRVGTDCILITVVPPTATLIMLYKGKKGTRDSELFSLKTWHLKTKWNNKSATVADYWEFGLGVSNGFALITGFNNICMVIV